MSEKSVPFCIISWCCNVLELYDNKACIILYFADGHTVTIGGCLSSKRGEFYVTVAGSASGIAATIYSYL